MAIFIGAAAAAALTLASCSDTDQLGSMQCAHPYVRQHIAFDWSLDPSASPAGMRIWLYPLDWKGDAHPVDLPGRDGSDVSVTPGRYRLISYNNDLEWVLPSGETEYGSHLLSTRDADILEPLRRATASRSGSTDSGQRVAACPEPVWGAKADTVDIKSDSQIVLSPAPLHCHYTFTFEDVGPLSHVAAASASISGMTPGIEMASLSKAPGLCTHPLAATVDRDGDSISGDFYTFGVPGTPGGENRMSLYVLMDNGDGYRFTQGDNLDVTSQIESAPDPRNVHLIIRGIHIPDVSAASGDFHIEVDGWGDDVHRDLPL